MTFLHNGPAGGVQLSLLRSPLYLRVVFNPEANTWDALDQLDDEPGDGETLHAYVRVGKPKSVHLDWTDRKTRRRMSGWWRIADYHWLADQPAQETMRSRERWRSWCELMWEMSRIKKEPTDGTKEHPPAGERAEPPVEGRLPPGDPPGGVQPQPQQGDD